MSGFQDQLNEAIINAFDALGGDPDTAVRNAKGKTFKQWVDAQKGQVAASGAASNLIPGAHVAAMAADMMFLMGKMSYTCWGIGAIKNCKVFGKPDFINIMDIWTGTAPKALEYAAISKAFYEQMEQLTKYDEMWDGFENKNLELEDYLVICNEAYRVIKTDEKIRKEFMALSEDKSDWTVKEKAQSGAKNVVLLKVLSTEITRKVGTKIGAKVMSKLGTRLATRVAGKIGTRLAAKATLGFVPVLGAVVGGGLNYFFIEGIAKSAEEYYSTPLKLDG
jgi:hypothetical protein